ncbi:MAG: hypothetical protein WD294_10360 [Phycisphaeraceae bacterium]
MSIETADFTGFTNTLAQAEGWLAWLLGLRQIDPTDPTVELSWQYPLPGWVWLLVIAAIITATWMGYRRMLGLRQGRIILTGVRVLALMTLALLLARPMLVLPRETIEPDHVLMLVDRSGSMQLRDVPDSAGDDDRTSREQQLSRILNDNVDVWGELNQRRRVQWLGFGDAITELGGPETLEAPDRPTTAMATAIRESLRRSAGKPISGVVIWSDGRSSEPVGAATWRLLEQLGVPAYVVALGAENPPMDLSIARVDAPDRAFVDDVVPVHVTVTQMPTDAAGADAPEGTRLQLIDRATGEVLDEVAVTRFGEPVQLATSPEAAGEVDWEVHLQSTTADLIDDNNQQTLEMTLVDRPIRLLYVEGYPRWEYRYLKNTVVREESIESSIMLVSADREFAQEGDVPLRRLPQTEEEIEDYDVIIIGDVPASFFSSDQMKLMLEQVSQRGAGLLWIGGEDATPDSYATSALGALLPMASSPSLASLGTPIDLVPTAGAEALGVLRFRWPEMDEEDNPWPEHLPSLMWAQSLGDLKPAAEALAIDANSSEPLVVRMRYGAGQSVYVATDEIWRWRYGRGELYPEQFWTQTIRMLARSRLEIEGEDSRARLAVSHRRASTGDTLVVELRVQDQQLLQREMDQVEVTVRDQQTSRSEGRLTLTATEQDGHYRGVWAPTTSGDKTLTVTSAGLQDLALQQDVHIERADDEMRDPRTDHAMLAELADRTGGSVLTEADLADLAQILPSRARHTAADITEPLWHSPLAFALLLLLLSGEWIGRRLMGLA